MWSDVTLEGWAAFHRQFPDVSRVAGARAAVVPTPPGANAGLRGLMMVVVVPQGAIAGGAPVPLDQLAPKGVLKGPHLALQDLRRQPMALRGGVYSGGGGVGVVAGTVGEVCGGGVGRPEVGI